MSISSKVDDFCVILKGLCDFLLVINSNLSLIFHHLATTHAWQTSDVDRHRVDDRHIVYQSVDYMATVDIKAYYRFIQLGIYKSLGSTFYVNT